MIIRLFGLGLLPPSARRPRLIEKSCRQTLKSEKKDGPGELNIIFSDRKKMKALNKRYLNHGHDTDVIAFRYPEEALPLGDDAPFGDIYVSARQAALQAAELGHSLVEEILTLVIHGTLHLLGYEDSTPRKKNIMFRKQDMLLGRSIR